MPDPCKKCDDGTLQNIHDLMSKAGEEWANNPCRPKITKVNLRKWNKFIEEWIDSPEVPLFVRKGKPRGQLITHGQSRRNILRVDNSPAQWIFKKACRGEDPPPIQDVVTMLGNSEIPVALALGKDERVKAHFSGLLGDQGVNSDGWKLAHIEPVGLKRNAALEEIDIYDIESHFKSLMSPGNMFVVPIGLAGIAEVSSFVDSFLKNTKSER